MISFQGLSPSAGENNVSLNSFIEFSIIDEASNGIDISSLKVLINGYSAIDNLEFKKGYDGASSDISPSGSDYSVIIEPESSFLLSNTIYVQIQVKDSVGSYFNKSYSFKTIPSEPVLVRRYPDKDQVITRNQFLYIEVEDSIDGIDPLSINLSINDLEYIRDGIFDPDENGDLSEITNNSTKAFIKVNKKEYYRNGDYKVEYSVADTLGNVYSDKYTFSVLNREDILPSYFTQVSFEGWYTGIKKVSDLGIGDSVKIEFDDVVPKDYTYDSFVLVYYNEDRLSTFEGLPKFIAEESVNSFNINNLSTGKSLSFGARGMEALTGVFDLTGMVANSDKVYVVPDAVEILDSVGDSDLFIPVSSVEGYPASGLLISNQEIIRYSSIDESRVGFNIPTQGRGLFNSSKGLYVEGDTISLYLSCQDNNVNIVTSTPTYQDGYDSGRVINSIGILYPDFSDNDQKFFQGYDFCGYHKDMPNNVLQDNGSCGSYLGGEFGGLRGFSLYDRMLNREEVLLEQVGEPVILLQRIINGEKCSCTTSRRDHPKSRLCQICYGTTFVGGFEQYCNMRREDRKIMVSIQEAPDDLTLGSQQHLEQDFKPSAWTLPMPAIKDRDLLVRFDYSGDVEYIYEVLNTSREKIIFGNYGRQKMNIQRLDKTDPYYSIITDELLNNENCS